MPLISLLLILVAGQSEFVIAKPGSTEYHRPACPLVHDARDVTVMTRAQAEARGLTPHADCDPSKAPPLSPSRPGARDGGRTSAQKPSPAFVYVSDGDRYYHRQTCAKLGAKRQRVALDTAARGHWPCPVCRPPIRARRR